jgi:ATP-dependent helicase Lhr and Lhr-like helicase
VYLIAAGSAVTTGSPTKLLIFANSRRECERLVSILQQEEHLSPFIFTHYSSLSSEVRVETEQKFLVAKTAICVATSTLELGIDIGDIDAVILWGVPGGVESFLQRIGRSNRRENKTNVICLVPDSSQNVLLDALCFLALIDAAKKGELPICSPYELFGAVGQQCLSIIASDNGRFTRISELSSLLKQKDYLERDILESILAELENNNYLQRHGFKNQYGAGENLYRLVDYRMIYGNFGSGSRTVELRYSSKVLGEVPADNLLRLRQGNLVRFAGQLWRVHKLSIEFILVEPAQNKGSAIDFNYSGRGIGYHTFICNRIWQLIHSKELPFDVLSSYLKESIQETTDNLRRVSSLQQIPYYSSTKGIHYFTFGGYLVNKAVALITRQINYHADDISLLVNSPVDWQSIPTEPQGYEGIFHLLFEKPSEQSIYQTLLPSQLQLREFLQTWLMDETIAEILSRLCNSKAIQIKSEII